MDAVPVFALGAAHVLLQGAAEGDVDDLEAAADGEQWHARLEGVPGDVEVEGVLEGVDVVDGVVGVGGAVAGGGEVAAAGEQDAVEAGQPGGGAGVRRVDARRFTARSPDGLDQGAGVDLGGVPEGGGRGREAGGDRDQGAGHSWIQVVLSSVYFSRAWADLSRPLPDCFMPPKGTVRSPSS